MTVALWVLLACATFLLGLGVGWAVGERDRRLLLALDRQNHPE